ncbi:phage tail fiber C-terminal domain-containing protein, partial [Escherichia coli]
NIIETNSHGWFPDTDGALITGLTFLDPKDATRVQGFFRRLQHSCDWDRQTFWSPMRMALSRSRPG